MKKRKRLGVKRVGYLLLSVSLLAPIANPIPVVAATTNSSEISESGSSLDTGLLTNDLPSTSQEETVSDQVAIASTYVTVTKKDYQFFADLEGKKRETATSLYEHTYLVEEKQQDETGTSYFQVSTQNTTGYLLATDVTEGSEAWGPVYPFSETIKVINKELKVFDESFVEIGIAGDLQDESYQATGVYHHSDGNDYYLLTNETGAFAAIIESSGVAVVEDETTETSDSTTTDTSSDTTTSETEDSITGESTTESTVDSSSDMTDGTVDSSTDAESTDSSAEAVTNTPSATTDAKPTPSIDQTTDDQGKPVVIDKYVSIVKKGQKLWETIDGNVLGTTDSLMDKTFHSTEMVTVDGVTYYQLVDGKGKFHGYVAATAIKLAPTPAGIMHSSNQYGSVLKANGTLWKNLELTASVSTKSLLNQTYHVKGWYRHLNGSKLFAIYDNSNKLLGYLKEGDLAIARNRGGIWHGITEYITVTKKTWSVWRDLEFKEGSSASRLYDQTYQVRGWYRHFNGAKYLSLYDNHGKWVGYLNEGGGKVTSNRGGLFHSTKTYVTITKKNWTLWRDFNFASDHSTNPYVNQTYQVRGWYRHYNGAKYLSLYDNHGKWLGYLNEGGGKVTTNRGGLHHSTKQYITITKKNWTLWRDFNFSKGTSTNNYVNHTYQVRGWYRHYNGAKYLSLYDYKGKWIGYLNEGGGKSGSNRGGMWHKTSQYVTVTKNNWTAWRDFDFKSGKSTSSLYKQTFKVTGWYRHYNGAKYYSLYDFSGKWQGYVNAEGAKVEKLPSSILLDVPWVSQFVPYYTPKGCAGASMTMLLRSKGINVSLKYVQDNLPMYPAVAGGQIGNPYSIYGFERVIQPDALTAYAKRWYPYVRNITGYTTDQIKQEVLSGNPVLFIGCSSYHHGGPSRNHCKVITGYRDGKFRVQDPLYNTVFDRPGTQGRGTYDLGPIYWESMSLFNAEYAKKAIVID